MLIIKASEASESDTIVSSNSFTVRPSKNLLIYFVFIQSGKVPKVRGWEGNLKSLSCNVGGGRGDEGALREMILGFVVEPLIFGTQNFYIYKRKSRKSPIFFGGLKHQLPNLTDLFDRCFSHTTGEGLQLRFWSLLDISGRCEPLYFAMFIVIF